MTTFVDMTLYFSIYTGIARTTGKRRKYFKTTENFNKFQDAFERIMRNPFPHLIEVFQIAMIVWLREMDEPAAADYFQKQWTGERGHYMLAHGGHGTTHHQC